MVYSKCSINVNDRYDDLGATFKRNKSNVYKSHLVHSSWGAALLITDPTLLSDFLQDSLVADFFWNTHLGISIFASSSDSPLRTPKHPVPFRPLQSIVQVLKVCDVGAFLVAQWLRVFLPMQGTRVRALAWEDPTCCGAAGPVSHNYWACASGAAAPQQERPRQWEARAPRWRVAPARCNWRKPSHRNEDPTQPNINK